MPGYRGDYRKIAAATVALIIGVAAAHQNQRAEDRSARVAWLSHNAVAIRSIDPTLANDSFADMEPLRTAIRNARVVVLGEESHGDGATFLAKGRLVKFLHERMGFDVLAWEAGLFNAHDMDAAVRDRSVLLDDAMGRGLFPIWALSAQVKSVFEYARSVAGTRTPLEMAGFDHQFSGAGPSRWRDALVAFLDKADPSLLAEDIRASLRNDVRRVFASDSSPRDIRLVAEKWRALLALFDAARAKLERAHPRTEVVFMRRTVDAALVSLEGLARLREAEGQFRAADNNLRDQWMGETLVWLANERYKGRRIIVWAASFHTLREPRAIKLGPDASFSYENVLTMGEVASRSLGDAVYTVAFTAAEGKATRVTGGDTLELEDPIDGSLEDLCLRTGRRFLFVNLRGLPSSHWLRRPTNAGVLGYSPITTDWTRQVDAVMFTRTMFPATKGPMAPDGAVLTEPSSVR
ncbi:MAG: hypothetical protein EHM13_07155 [Acidobacteria bacterium]|nr:MAG: hypothetical protein EHM13_07155 [Acidobacteriota bacterium]